MQVPTYISNLGVFLIDYLKFDESQVYLRQALDYRMKNNQNDHKQIGSSIQNLGTLLMHKDKINQAEILLKLSLEYR